MKPRVLPWRGTKTKFDRKWHAARVSVGMAMAGCRACSKGLFAAGRAAEDSLVLDKDPSCQRAFLLALCAFRSVDLVSFRSIKSNSSLYPGHCRLDLAHWLQVGFVSSH